MTHEKTIKDVLESLHDAMQEALPDMDVYINIQVGPKKDAAKQSSKPTKHDLECLKATLNGYAKTAGKKKAFAMVREFTDGSDNPDHIPPEEYPELFSRMKKEGVDRIEVNLSKKDREAA